MSKSLYNRLRAVFVTLVVVLVANIAISFAMERTTSGMTLPTKDRPKTTSGMTLPTKDRPRTTSGMTLPTKDRPRTTSGMTLPTKDRP
jgi:hypothetical protein